MHGDGQGRASAQAGRSIYQNPGRSWRFLQLKLGAEAGSLNLSRQQHQNPSERRGAPRAKRTPLQQMLKMSEGGLGNAKTSAAVEPDIALGPGTIVQPAPRHSVPGADSLKPQTTLHRSSCCPDRGGAALQACGSGRMLAGCRSSAGHAKEAQTWLLQFVFP